MRISDWSSDGCSSDLDCSHGPFHALITRLLVLKSGGDRFERSLAIGRFDGQARSLVDIGPGIALIIGGDRKSVVEGKSVSVRVDIGGRRIIKKQNEEKRILIEQ